MIYTCIILLSHETLYFMRITFYFLIVHKLRYPLTLLQLRNHFPATISTRFLKPHHPIPWTRHYPILIHQFTLHTHSFTGLHAQGKPRHTSKTITVISLHSLPMPLPLFGILLTQSCLILVFLPHIFILSCLYRQPPNLPLMLKLLVMTTGLRLCMLSYRLYNWITLGLLPFFLLTKLPLVVVGYIKSSTALMGL